MGKDLQRRDYNTETQQREMGKTGRGALSGDE